MEKLLLLFVSLSFPPTLALLSTRCTREELSKCTWACAEVEEVLNFECNSESINIQCASGNTYTVGLCDDVSCERESDVMACSNVTGPEMFLSNVTVTIDYNEDQPDQSQINLSGHRFFIALNKGHSEDNACMEIAADVYQAFLFVKTLPFVTPSPLTPAKPVPVDQLGEGLGSAVFSLAVIVLAIYAEMVEILMKHGALVNAPDHNGTTPLHLACQKDMQKAVLLLLDCGAHINAVDSAQNTPLHLACSHGHDKVVNALVFNRWPKCKINAVNDEGNTPLHNATRWGFASVVRQLLIHGAELEVVNSDQQTPLDCAHSRVREALHHRRASISHKATGSANTPQPQDNPVKRRHRKGHDREVNRLLSAAEAGDINLIRFLLDWGVKLSSPMKQLELCHPMCQCKKCLPYTEARGRLNVNLHDSKGMTALHKACLHGHANLAKELVDHGALTDVQTSAKLFTPLHYSCIYNQHECVSVLLGAGASVNMNDINGSTPLHNCAISCNLTSAENLLAHKANPNSKDSKGNTPLHHAARWAHKGLVSVLLTHGADYLIRNSDEQTAEEVTKDEEMLEVFQKADSGQLHAENMAPALVMPKPVEVTSKGSVQSL